MPYGVAKEKGGDSPSNDLKMEHCVQSVMRKNPKLDKVSAIKICKKNAV